MPISVHCYFLVTIDSVLNELEIDVTFKNKPIASNSYHSGHSQKNISDTSFTMTLNDTANSGRDDTKYLFNGNIQGKGRLVLEIVKEYLKQNPVSFDTLKQIFPDKMQKFSIGVINTLEYIKNKYQGKSKKRHFVKSNEILVTADNVRFAVSTEWGSVNIKNILDFAMKEGYYV